MCSQQSFNLTKKHHNTAHPGLITAHLGLMHLRGDDLVNRHVNKQRVVLEVKESRNLV